MYVIVKRLLIGDRKLIVAGETIYNKYKCILIHHTYKGKTIVKRIRIKNIHNRFYITYFLSPERTGFFFLLCKKFSNYDKYIITVWLPPLISNCHDQR